MAAQNFGRLVSFIFGIANDCLVDTYDVGDYRKIILPMMVIRRFDAVLEPTKEAVLRMKADLDAAGITEQDEALCSVANEAFCNSSPYILSDLKSRTNQQQLKNDFILYLDGFSKNVQDIIRRFEFRTQIDKLSEHDILGLLISKFTDPSINLSSRPILDDNGHMIHEGLDNHTMGTVFEEVIRKFNEEISYDTWTPEIVCERQKRLMEVFTEKWELALSDEELTEQDFLLAGRGGSAKGFPKDRDTFIVRAGSRIAPDVASSFQAGYLELRNKLIDDGIIVNNVFAVDQEFSSVSAAAAVILGRAANGRREWTKIDGQTYAQAGN